MSLETQLLQQIISTQNEIKDTLGQHTSSLHELLGNGQPGKVGRLEMEVRELQAAHNERKGFRIALDVTISFLVSAATAAGTILGLRHHT